MLAQANVLATEAMKRMWKKEEIAKEETSVKNEDNSESHQNKMVKWDIKKME